MTAHQIGVLEVPSLGPVPATRIRTPNKWAKRPTTLRRTNDIHNSFIFIVDETATFSKKLGITAANSRISSI
jgi:hypothetical protein